MRREELARELAAREKQRARSIGGTQVDGGREPRVVQGPRVATASEWAKRYEESARRRASTVGVGGVRQENHITPVPPMHERQVSTSTSATYTSSSGTTAPVSSSYTSQESEPAPQVLKSDPSQDSRVDQTQSASRAVSVTWDASRLPAPLFSFREAVHLLSSSINIGSESWGLGSLVTVARDVAV